MINVFYCIVDFVIPQRVILAIMGFLAIVNAYTMRISLSIAITELVVRRNHSSTNDMAFCPANDLGSSTSVRLPQFTSSFQLFDISI